MASMVMATAYPQAGLIVFCLAAIALNLAAMAIDLATIALGDGQGSAGITTEIGG